MFYSIIKLIRFFLLLTFSPVKKMTLIFQDRCCNIFAVFTHFSFSINRNFLFDNRLKRDSIVMPLPPALAARLAKRGIISKKSAQQAKPQEEEVFAESYDDQEDNNGKSNQDTFEKVKYLGYPCCPNKWNVYHECSVFCQNHWSNRRSTGPDPDSEYAAKYKAMMSKFGPLPEHWQEKWDPGCRRHYYWCTKTGFFKLPFS